MLGAWKLNERMGKTSEVWNRNHATYPSAASGRDAPELLICGVTSTAPACSGDPIGATPAHHVPNRGYGLGVFAGFHTLPRSGAACD
jgi:hypothetical protein